LKDKQIRENKLLLVSVIIILIVTLCPGNGKIAGDYLDKVAHFIVFLILSINICYKYQKNEVLIEFMFLAILFGLLTEVIQQIVPGRNMDIYDGIADTMGVVAGFYFYRRNQAKIDKIIVKFA